MQFLRSTHNIFFSKCTAKILLTRLLKSPRDHRIINSPRRIFINDEFVKALEESHLIGYNIEELWNSEE